ncbi:hypothetical protein [Mycolicibacterium sp.]|uniref:hypothetical protein n=1 Tax=Mycolicibacterium sp. TaxID=2320850 RepID=UPI001DF7967E|nr:hypothetical protein [Mycolicibacterium sp.]MCB1292420.1 hypothetical protein [Mycobacterium sp.]MCB9409431.1 hypothetical protein [Mycolicibacterium sp.]
MAFRARHAACALSVAMVTLTGCSTTTRTEERPAATPCSGPNERYCSAASGTDLNELTPYLGLVQRIGEALVALPPDSAIDAGRTAEQLGRMEQFGKKAFDALPRPIDSPKPGKLAYAIAYKDGL